MLVLLTAFTGPAGHREEADLNNIDTAVDFSAERAPQVVSRIPYVVRLELQFEANIDKHQHPTPPPQAPAAACLLYGTLLSWT